MKTVYYILTVTFSLPCFSSCEERKVEGSCRPNILFCIADDISFPHMGAYGTQWVQTPGFDRVAREGLLFQRMYTCNAKSAPSRSCIITGRNSWQLEEACNHWPSFPSKFKSYPEVLSQNGYYVGATGKGWGPGIAKDSLGNTRHLVGQLWNQKKLQPSTSGISNIDYASNLAYARARLGDMEYFESTFHRLLYENPDKKEVIHKYLKLALEKLDILDRFDTFI